MDNLKIITRRGGALELKVAMSYTEKMIAGLFLFIWMSTALAESPSQFLPDGTLRPGIRVTILAGQEKEIRFRPEGVRFLAGRARIISAPGPIIDPHGQKKLEIKVNADDTTRGIPWIHYERPFRLRIRAETNFTLEARESAARETKRELT